MTRRQDQPVFGIREREFAPIIGGRALHPLLCGCLDSRMGQTTGVYRAEQRWDMHAKSGEKVRASEFATPVAVPHFQHSVNVLSLVVCQNDWRSSGSLQQYHISKLRQLCKMLEYVGVAGIQCALIVSNRQV